eukprot:gnl/Ergobibamus_cyprinoides/536.p2 GENE.gnl/Ergobibamus_cyprinoides/536~~gnl/Ergobibamus_cyprinoides/536.p2  ORF type:complete len:268 (+),score=79.37 gnl/Ergobibamus_cyprinoides/536:104-805(+)
MKVVRRIHSVTRTVEISETALAHRKIVPFNNYGDAAGDVDVTPKQVLSLVPESMKTIAARRGERDAADGTFSGSKTVTCPICGGPHFKIHCPNKHLSQTQARLDALNAGPEEDAETGASPTHDENGRYIPPHLRTGTATRRAVSLSEPCLRAEGISPEVCEGDLYALFETVHVIPSRCKIPRNYETGESRGFAYINFNTEEAMRNVLEKFDGHRMSEFHCVLQLRVFEQKDRK